MERAKSGLLFLRTELPGLRCAPFGLRLRQDRRIEPPKGRLYPCPISLGGSFMTLLTRTAIAVFAVLTVAAPASAQTYPSKPVKMIVPFGAGGPADVFARVLAHHLGESLKQNFVIENRPGDGAIIGTDAVAKSPPDGYTLLVMSNTHTTNESLIPNRPYQLMRDFAPIAPINSSDLLMVAHPSVAKDLKVFIAAAKAKPGA